MSLCVCLNTSSLFVSLGLRVVVVVVGGAFASRLRLFACLCVSSCACCLVCACDCCLRVVACLFVV